MAALPRLPLRAAAATATATSLHPVALRRVTVTEEHAIPHLRPLCAAATAPIRVSTATSIQPVAHCRFTSEAFPHFPLRETAPISGFTGTSVQPVVLGRVTAEVLPHHPLRAATAPIGASMATSLPSVALRPVTADAYPRLPLRSAATPIGGSTALPPVAIRLIKADAQPYLSLRATATSIPPATPIRGSTALPPAAIRLIKAEAQPYRPLRATATSPPSATPIRGSTVLPPVAIRLNKAEAQPYRPLRATATSLSPVALLMTAPSQSHLSVLTAATPISSMATSPVELRLIRPESDPHLPVPRAMSTRATLGCFTASLPPIGLSRATDLHLIPIRRATAMAAFSLPHQASVDLAGQFPWNPLRRLPGLILAPNLRSSGRKQPPSARWWRTPSGAKAPALPPANVPPLPPLSAQIRDRVKSYVLQFLAQRTTEKVIIGWATMAGFLLAGYMIYRWFGNKRDSPVLMKPSAAIDEVGPMGFLKWFKVEAVLFLNILKRVVVIKAESNESNLLKFLSWIFHFVNYMWGVSSTLSTLCVLSVACFVSIIVGFFEDVKKPPLNSSPNHDMMSIVLWEKEVELKMRKHLKAHHIHIPRPHTIQELREIICGKDASKLSLSTFVLNFDTNIEAHEQISNIVLKWRSTSNDG